MGAFALLGKHCPTGLALILARYNKDPGQKQQALGEVIATGRTLAPAYLAKLTRRADGKAITSVALLALDGPYVTASAGGSSNAACCPVIARTRASCSRVLPSCAPSACTRAAKS